MGEQTIQRFCPQCQRNVAASRPGVNHLLHFLIGLFTIGCWWVVWACLVVFGGGTYRCGTCGNPQLAPPQFPPPQSHGGYGPPPGYGPPGGYGPPPGSGQWGPPR